MSEGFSSPNFEAFSNDWLADRYLKFGSVEEAINSYQGHFPVSVADYHRKIKQFGIIKKVGRRKVSLAKTLYFFTQKALEPAIPIEKLYKSMPLTFQESASIATIHRIYNNLMEKVVRLEAAGVIITKSGQPERVLIVDELESRAGTGKVSGSSTIPFSFANRKEDMRTKALRVLQQEFSTHLTLGKKLTTKGSLAKKLVPKSISPILHFHLLDVEINIFHIELPGDFDMSTLSSYNVKNHRFVHVDDIVRQSPINFRVSVPEIVAAYCKQMFGQTAEDPQIITSSLNHALLAVATEAVPSQK